MIFAVIRIVNMVFTVYYFIILGRVFMSYFNPDPYNPVVRFIFTITEPFLAPLRRFSIVGGFDLSPVFAMIILIILNQVITNALASLVR